MVFVIMQHAMRARQVHQMMVLLQIQAQNTDGAVMVKMVGQILVHVQRRYL